MVNEEIKELEERLGKLRADDGRGEVVEDIVDTLNDLSKAYYSIDPEIAENYAGEAGEIAREGEYLKGLGRSYRNLGISYGVRGDYYRALEQFDKCVEIYKDIGHRKGLAGVNINIGIVYSNIGDYSKSLEWYYECVDLCKDAGYDDVLASAFINIGVLYSRMHNLEKALENYFNGIKIYEKIGNKRSIAKTYANIGNILRRKGELDKALDYANKSLNIKMELNDTYGMAHVFELMGLIYLEMDEFEKSIEYFLKSFELAEEIEDKHRLIGNCFGLSVGYIELNEFDKALNYLEKGVGLAREIGSKDMEMEGYELLAEFYEERGDYESSLKYYKEHWNLKDEIIGERYSERIANLEVKHEVERKEKEAEIYRLRNVELQEAYDKIDGLLRNILPDQIVQNLNKSGGSPPRIVDNSTIVFIDIVGFTESTRMASPEELLGELTSHFKAYDEIVKEFGLEKLKTYGDGYMYAGGLFSEGNQAEECAEAALKILNFVSTREWEVRIGIHTGSCIAGLVKGWRMIYDIWGDTVNITARIQQASQPGRINVSKVVYDELKDKFNFEPRGEVSVHNNMEPLPMYFLRSRR